ncbi:MAG: helix-turn-helix domain-containing protein [Puniceicoccales bacterium]|nr:helix-turn-helix domain-containing protein [Puniceicoccales bacterium]
MAMVNVGKQLKKAREALKLTLKDAEEVTKIRGDFLAAFEDGDGDIPLPEVYQRGFLRIYAEFLHLNPDQIVPQVDGKEKDHGLAISNERPMALAGEMDPPTVEKPEVPENAGGVQGNHQPRTPLHVILWENLRKKVCERQWQIRIGSIATVIVLGFLLLKFIPRKGNALEELLDRNPVEVIAMEDVQSKRITLTASDSVQVLVRDKNTKENLFSGTLKKGESRHIDYYDNVQISFSNGSALSVHRGDGKDIKTKNEGIGWMEVNY